MYVPRTNANEHSNYGSSYMTERLDQTGCTVDKIRISQKEHQVKPYRMQRAPIIY